MLGDLEVGNGDPSLTEFGKIVTPNLHRLARKFVDLDNFYDSSEVSMDGWPWSTSARAPDVVEKQTPVNYAVAASLMTPKAAIATSMSPIAISPPA